MRIPLAATLAALALSACDRPTGIEAGPLTLNDAPPDARMRAGYFTLHNHDARTRTLTHARSDAWDLVEIHATEMVDGVARMRELDKVTIGAGESIVFEPFGRHLMLMRPTQAAADGPLTIDLCFADGECLPVTTAD